VSVLRTVRTPNLGRFQALLATMLLLMIALPAFSGNEEPSPLAGILLSGLLVAGVYAVSRRRRVLIGALALALPALAFEWISYHSRSRAADIADLALLAIFVAFVAGVILLEILRETHVTMDTVFGGICIYLLAGVAWALVHDAIEAGSPGSYLIAGQPFTLSQGGHARFPEFSYFSFVTLTTLGFGDIVPVHRLARALCTLEAVIGQLYVAIFVARLVGLHLTHGGPRDGS
jgi:voltage-gated potassium channel